MPDDIMDGFFSTVLEQATYSGRNKGIFLKKSKWSHFSEYMCKMWHNFFLKLSLQLNFIVICHCNWILFDLLNPPQGPSGTLWAELNSLIFYSSSPLIWYARLCFEKLNFWPLLTPWEWSPRHDLAVTTKICSIWYTSINTEYICKFWHKKILKLTL